MWSLKTYKLAYLLFAKQNKTKFYNQSKRINNIVMRTVIWLGSLLYNYMKYEIDWTDKIQIVRSYVYLKE